MTSSGQPSSLPLRHTTKEEKIVGDGIVSGERGLGFYRCVSVIHARDVVASDGIVSGDDVVVGDGGSVVMGGWKLNASRMTLAEVEAAHASASNIATNKENENR
ncbi:hypothetical protein E3N88_38055 [Mikania micrantha]|uniref:Uncharacterized protein n=1 Tax=Mikania micrantha TaxID=192012 RepID=A0A5N6LSV2_9ASTR|nr:hypothetical protein E3N88_38055 [Mikania micrantha]